MIALLLLIAIIYDHFGFVFCSVNSKTMCCSSTIIEKTFHNENGELERGRNESVQSNVLSLINNDRTLRETGDSNLETSFGGIDRQMERIFRATTIRNYLLLF